MTLVTRQVPAGRAYLDVQNRARGERRCRLLNEG